MRKHYGISLTIDSFVLAVAVFRRGKWRAGRCLEWPRMDRFRRFLLLHRGVWLAIPAHWKKKSSMVPAVQGAAVTETETHEIHALQTDIDEGLDAFAGNLLGIVAEDSFLQTIPLHCRAPSAPRSFVSVHADEQVLRMGIVIEGKLHTSFHLPPAQTGNFAWFWGRMERYWYLHGDGNAFPTEVLIIGDAGRIPLDIFQSPPQVIALGGKYDANPASIKAFGAALVGADRTVPLLHRASIQAQYRWVRSLLYAASVILVAVGLLTTLTCAAASALSSRHHSRAREAFTRLTLADSALAHRAAICRELDASVLTYADLFRLQTNWAPLLAHLARAKPEGITVERLGSQPGDEQGSPTQIAVSGSAQTRLLVNRFLSNLKEFPHVDAVRVSELGNAKADPDSFHFRISGTLR